MDNIKKIKVTSEFVEIIEKTLENVVKFNLLDEAKYFLNELWPKISNSNVRNENPDLYKKIKRVQYQCMILIIPSLSEKKLLELFENGIGWYYKEMSEYFSIWELLRANLIIIYPRSKRDDLKKKLQKALLLNQAEITSSAIISPDGNQKKPTIKNWLHDYIASVGAESTDNLNRTEYFVNNKNFNKLPENEKRIIKNLIDLFNSLNTSSDTIEGMEEKVVIEEDGKILVLSDGNYEYVDSKVASLADKLAPVTEIKFLEEDKVLQKDDKNIKQDSVKVSEALISPNNSQKEIISAYQGDSKQQQEIVKQESQISKKTNGNPEALRAEFFSAVQKKNISKTIAAIRLLANTNDLLAFISEDKKLNTFLKAIWKQSYGQKFADDFAKNPKQQKFLRRFLRYVLEERLEIDTSEAARIAIQIGNILATKGEKGYNRMAYYDVKTKKFEWLVE